MGAWLTIFASQFILEGLPSVLTAPLIWFCFPDWPETATFLSAREKEVALYRLAQSPKGADKLTRKDAIETLTDWRLYFHYLAYIVRMIGLPFNGCRLGLTHVLFDLPGHLGTILKPVPLCTDGRLGSGLLQRCQGQPVYGTAVLRGMGGHLCRRFGG